MWMQFHSSSSTSWPQSLNVVVPFQFFNYFGLHFVAGKSNMIDCIFITLHKDFCGPLVLGGKHRIYLPLLAGTWILHPQGQDDKLPPHTVSRDNIQFGPIRRLQSWGMWWDLWGAHLNVVATFILSCFAVLKFEGIVVRVSPIWGTKTKQNILRSIVPRRLSPPFF